jgi:hypothetical protein
VQTAPGLSNARHELALDERVDVLVAAASEAKNAGSPAPDVLNPAGYPSVFWGQTPASMLPPAAAAHVVLEETTIESKRGAEVDKPASDLPRSGNQSVHEPWFNSPSLLRRQSRHRHIAPAPSSGAIATRRGSPLEELQTDRPSHANRGTKASMAERVENQRPERSDKGQVVLHSAQIAVTPTARGARCGDDGGRRQTPATSADQPVRSCRAHAVRAGPSPAFLISQHLRRWRVRAASSKSISRTPRRSPAARVRVWTLPAARPGREPRTQPAAPGRVQRRLRWRRIRARGIVDRPATSRAPEVRCICRALGGHQTQCGRCRAPCRLLRAFHPGDSQTFAMSGGRRRREGIPSSTPAWERGRMNSDEVPCRIDQ